MHVSIYSVRPGRGHSADLDSLTGSYLRRLAGSWKADARVFRTEKALLEQTAADHRNGAARWILDARGKMLPSDGIARALHQLRAGGIRRLVACVGPADGWSDGALDGLQGNDLLLSLGPLTMPHEVARLVVAEQIYRATTILAGHPYHLGHE